MSKTARFTGRLFHHFKHKPLAADWAAVRTAALVILVKQRIISSVLAGESDLVACLILAAFMRVKPVWKPSGLGAKRWAMRSDGKWSKAILGRNHCSTS